MRRLLLTDNTISSDQKKILIEQNKFYRKLYSKNPEVEFSLQNESGTTFSDEDRIEIIQKLTIEGLDIALRKLNLDKTPGCDGLPPEWCEVFWPKIKVPLHEAYNYTINKGELHLSATRGIISLFPKATKIPYYSRTGGQSRRLQDLD